MAPGWLDRLLSLVFPKTCVVCGTVVAYNELWCGRCVPPRKSGALCPHCGHALSCCCCHKYTVEDWNFSRAIAPFWYEGDLRIRLLELKRKPNSRLCSYLSAAMCQYLREQVRPLCFQAVAPVPASSERLAATNRNHAEELAAEVAGELGISLLPRALERFPQSKVQHQLGGRDRFQNACGSYGLKDASRLADKHILLVDDIFTTGATAHYCAGLLRKAGAKSVAVLTASTTNGKKVEIR